MKSSQISVDFFFPAQLSLQMSNKKTPFPPTALPGFMFPMSFFLSFSFLLFPVKTHGKKNKWRHRTGRGKRGSDRVSQGGKVASQQKGCWDSSLNRKACISLNCFEMHIPALAPFFNQSIVNGSLCHIWRVCASLCSFSLAGISFTTSRHWERLGKPHLWVTSPNRGAPEPIIGNG